MKLLPISCPKQTNMHAHIHVVETNGRVGFDTPDTTNPVDTYKFISDASRAFDSPIHSSNPTLQ